MEIQNSRLILKKLARNFGKFIVRLKDSLKDHDKTQLYSFLENIQKKWAKNISEEISLISLEDLEDIFFQTLAYASFWEWLEFRSKKSFSDEFKIVNKIKDGYTFLNSFDFFFIANISIPCIVLNQVLLPIERKLRGYEWVEFQSITSNLMSTFYSDFLKIYNPDISKKLGVIFTPIEVANYMISGIDYFLKNLFKIKNGLIDPSLYDPSILENVNILEPSAGTMTFLIGLIDYCSNNILKLQLQRKDSNEIFENWINSYFLKKVSAIEILLTPLIIGYYKIIRTLNEKREIFNDEYGNITWKLPLHRKNSLFPADLNNDNYDKNQLHGTNHIQIIMGNPPYNLQSQNNSKWIQDLIKDYKLGLNEKNLKILSDDYVKFIRYAQWKITDSGSGIVSFITNNNYIDGPVFKVMRKVIYNSFDYIYIVNLHGNVRKNENANLFDVKVGIAIIFLIKTPNISEKVKEHAGFPNKTKIKYLDVNYKTVEDKLHKLSHCFNEDDFISVPLMPEYYFSPKDVNLEVKFRSFYSIDDLFIESPKSGIMAGRDSLVSNPDKEILKENIELFFKQDYDAFSRLGIKIKKTKNWDPERALQKFDKSAALNNIIPYNYRGMDIQYLIYDKALVEGPRTGYIDLITRDNPAISVSKTVRSGRFSHALVTSNPPEKCFLSVKDSSYVFPLRLSYNGQKYNLKAPITTCSVELEHLFYYIYGILFSPSYRNRYNSQLIRQLPRIPFPSSNTISENHDLFEKMSSLGKKLAEIHLKHPNIIDTSEFSISFDKEFKIIKPNYSVSEKRIYFNLSKQKNGSIAWIGDISSDMWEFEIGSIRQLENWLKSRIYINPNMLKTHNKIKRHKGLQRPLQVSEINEFLKICSSIKKTLKILPKLDNIYLKIDPI